MNRSDSNFLLHIRFAEQSKITPHRVAVHHNGESITFSELNAQAERVAARLRSIGIVDGSMIGLYMERSINYVASLLGILMSNSAVVPLPPTYPETRIKEILSFAELPIIIDDDEKPINPRIAPSVLHLSGSHPLLDETIFSKVGDSHQPAFVLCSSGSTGAPKMIVRSHRSFFHRLHWTWQNHPYENEELCCQKSHASTTHSIYELFEPMLRGVPIFILSDHETRDTEIFWHLIRSKRISRLLIVPSALRAGLEMPLFSAPGVRVLVLMGEYVSNRFAEQVIQKFPHQTKIFSIYGSTEASSTLVCDLKKNFHVGEELPLGEPISSDIHAHILDEKMEQVESGKVGVLHIAGPALFDGYFRNKTLTDSVLRLLPNGKGKLYNTKDQVRLLSDGNVHFVGRTDHTVKVRGFRVELQEVERALSLHPIVKQAAVLLTTDREENAILIGFVVLRAAEQVDLYSFLRERLPDYMVPSAIIDLDPFPLTSSGKTDRTKLLEAYAQRTLTTSESIFASKTQTQVYEVWKKVLKHGSIRSNSRFFEAGGTSLTVFQLVHQLRQHFGFDRIQLNDQSIYRFQTIESLAEHIDNLNRGHADIARDDLSILVTMKEGADADLSPFFLIASGGGTLGAYAKLAKALKTRREVVGVRDPFIWGERDPTMAFQDWVSVYLEAIRSRQPKGPYYLGAYSSGGSLCLEVAQRLRQQGQDVALLALVDPLAVDCLGRWSFGYWALRAMFSRRLFKQLVLAAGGVRLGLSYLRLDGLLPKLANNGGVTKNRFQQLVSEARNNGSHVIALSWLLQLNTGFEYSLTNSDISKKQPSEYLPTLLSRIEAITPGVDPATIERIFIQYYCLQVPAQHSYRLQRYKGKVVIFEPDGLHKGLLAAVFRPFINQLQVICLKFQQPPKDLRVMPENISKNLLPHYLCMRDDEFVGQLSEKLDHLLRQS